jgi:hypothetical protein
MMEFVAFRVATKVIVVIQDQDAGIRTSDLLSEKMSSRKTADPCSDYDQVVLLAQARRLIPDSAADQRMSLLPGPVMASPQTSKCWWIW